MKNPAGIFVILSIFLVLCVTMMGCSSSSGSTATTTTSAVTTATTTAPLYTAGDIVWSSSASTTAAWLIISYDSSTDSYTRAYVHKNTDGSWGYRTNSDTATSPRPTMEKVYPVKVTHVTVSSIPTAAPTLVVSTTVATAVTTTTAATATTTIAGKPLFKDIVPSEGYAGTSVAITDLSGGNFQSGATVQLAHSGSTINATSVVWVSATELTCTFVIPSTAVTGSWDVVVTNPDGQFVSYANEFIVHGSTSSVTTTTTTAASTGSITISSVTASPGAATGTGQAWSGRLTIETSGTTLQSGLTVTLSNTATGANVTAPYAQLNSGTEAYPSFSGVPAGTYNVIITNPDGSTGTLSSGFIVS